MSLYHPVPDTPGICMRCHKKMSRKALKADPNIQGLLVCKDCCDELDPYRKPQRQPENITINRPLVDEPLE